MVHVRLNAQTSNPNPFVNFITALPTHGNPQDSQQALELLNALAAQVKPIMKSHGFTVNSLEEYEHNQVFSGRNWNNGETIELVLRRPDGSFVPTAFIMSTFCHELAHIMHMNHGPDFQALWRRLRAEVRQLQDKGYYGDGFWSSGTHLASSERVSGSGLEVADMPEFMCGGAQQKSQAPRRRRRRRRPPKTGGPSNHTGRQTEKQRKPGTRVRSAYAFTGEGTALNADDPEGQASKKGTGFGKRAQSNRAREERAAAAERRLKALATPAPSSPPPQGSDTEEEDEGELIPETDQERRDHLRDALGSDETLDAMKLEKFSWGDLQQEFKFPSADADVPKAGPSKGSKGSDDVIELDSSETESEEEFSIFGCDAPTISAPSGTGASGGSRSDTSGKGKGKRKGSDDEAPEPNKRAKNAVPTKSAKISPAPRSTGSGTKGKTAQNSGRTLGGSLADTKPKSQEQKWECRICTFVNLPLYLACGACSTPKA
ncbi:WLM domain-containing protein [Pterulicium gracile]|uniref:WLM domain-containing protein n=1 Tax=Pterulicium gracile TaxID=1884261 RepID=A0A5C3QUH0_9AGAR|nr:WLM domain-containing protein [Pterula gracilis]